MRDFIINEESFSLGLMEKVPEPEANECFLLYQSGAGADASMVISNGGRYSSTAVRHRHYNKKVVLSLRTLDFNEDYRIVMVDVDFHFNVNVKVSYKLRDAQKYFFMGKMDDEGISSTVRQSVRKQNKRWNVSQGWELQDKLEELIERELKRYQGVEFKLTIEVTPDEEALKIQKSNRSKVVGIHTSNNMTEEQIVQNENKEKIKASEFKYKIEQLKDTAFMIKNFGELGPIMNEYLRDNINGIELYNYIMQSKTDEMNLLRTAMETDALTQAEAIDKLNAILDGRRFANSEQQLLGENRKEQESLQEKEQEMQENDIDQDSYTDGGFV